MMKEKDGHIEPGYSWRTPPDQPGVAESATTYNGDGVKLANTRMHEWEHPLSDVVMSVTVAGMQLDYLHEHEVLPWRRLPMMVPAGDRMFGLPDTQVRMPLGYSLKAWKRAWRSDYSGARSR
jgi:hypothetical protein